MDLTGSGNETSAHLLENGRITFMFVALYGSEDTVFVRDRSGDLLLDTPEWEALAPCFELYPGTRQI